MLSNPNRGFKVTFVNASNISSLKLEPGHLLGLDIESSWCGKGNPLSAPDFEIRLSQLGTEDEAWVFDTASPAVKKFLSDFLDDKANSFCSHTDYDVMSSYRDLGVDISARNIDTRLLSVMANPGDFMVANDLKSLARRFGMKFLGEAQESLYARFKELYAEAFPEEKRAPWEAIQSWAWNNIPIDDPAYVHYAAADAVACRRLLPILVAKLQIPESLLVRELWLWAVAMRIRLKGMIVDEPRLRELHDAAEENCTKYQGEFGALVTETILRGRGKLRGPVQIPVSPRSSKKVVAFLRERGVQFDSIPLTKTGQAASKAGALSYDDLIAGSYASLSKKFALLLRAAAKESENEEAIRCVEVMLAFKETVYDLTKCKEVYALISPTGRIHPRLVTIGAVTGRMASTSPNFQNLGRGSHLREAFLAEDGHTMIRCDYAQVEVRVAAGLSQDEILINLIINGLDIHQNTADATGTTRQDAKITVFLGLFGGGAPALYIQTGIPESVGREVLRRFWGAYPQLAEYRDWTKTQSVPILLSGRPVPVGNDDTGRPRSHKSLNFYVQGNARDLIVHSLYLFEQRYPASAFWVVHDELMVQVPNDQVAEARAYLEKCMTFDFLGVPITSESDILLDETGQSRWIYSGHLAAMNELRESMEDDDE